MACDEPPLGPRPPPLTPPARAPPFSRPACRARRALGHRATSLSHPHVAHSTRSPRPARRPRRSCRCPIRGSGIDEDPLDGTIADYQAGRRRGAWTAAEVTARALERCRADGHARGAPSTRSSATALADARAADARLRAGRTARPARRRSRVRQGDLRHERAADHRRRTPSGRGSFPTPCGATRSRWRGSARPARSSSARPPPTTSPIAATAPAATPDRCCNPHDPTGTRTPGGSSAGSAVAVASGMAFAALGTDDGGSNRIPAQFTGVVGMKPTFGLVPRTGVIPTWPYLDTHGPLARTVADAALLLAAIAGRRPVGSARASRRAWDGAPLAALRDDALAGVRLGLVEAHVPRAQMTRRGARGVGPRGGRPARRRRHGRAVRAGGHARDLSERLRRCGGHGAATSSATRSRRPPPPTRSTATSPGAPAIRARRCARGYAAYRAFYDVLPDDLRGVRAAPRASR